MHELTERIKPILKKGIRLEPNLFGIQSPDTATFDINQIITDWLKEKAERISLMSAREGIPQDLMLVEVKEILDLKGKTLEEKFEKEIKLHVKCKEEKNQFATLWVLGQQLAQIAKEHFE